MGPLPVTSICDPRRLGEGLSLWSGVGDRARRREEMPCSLSPLAEQVIADLVNRKASRDTVFLQA